MNKFKKQILSFVILLVIFAAPVMVFAQLDGNTDTETQYFPDSETIDLVSSDEDSLTETVIKIINAVLGILGLIAVIIILIGGFKWMVANGSEERVKDAKDTIKYGLIGLSIILLAYIIVQVVMSAVVKLGTGQVDEL
jgi:amino acid transporter